MKKKYLAGTGFLLIILSMFLLCFDAPITGITYLAGVILLCTGCFPWACKLHWFVALAIGVLMIATTFFASTFIPLIIKDQFRGDERNDFLINLIASILFWPGIVLISMTPIIAAKNRRKRNEAKSGTIALSASTNQKTTPNGIPETGERNEYK